MRTIKKMNKKSSGWLSQVGRLLIYSILLGIILSMGWYQPNAAYAETLLAGPNTALATSPKSATAAYVVMSRITVSSGGAVVDGKVELNQLTLDDNGASATQYGAARVFISSTASTTLPTDAIQIGRTSGVYTGGSTTITLGSGSVADRTITTGSPEYLYVLYDMMASQATFTAQSRVTAIGVVAGDTGASGLSYLSNQIRLSASTATATITNCYDCHGDSTDPYMDSPTRSAATGSFVGSHNKHAGSMGYACTMCHIDNTSSGTGHRLGYVNMSNPIYNAGGSYSKASGPTYSFPQVNNPVMGSCSSVYCHSTAQTTAGGLPATYMTPSWGNSSLGCSGCHVDMLNDASGTGSHRMHANTANISCDVCHGAGYSATTVALSTHVNSSINVSFTGAALATKYSQSLLTAPGNGYGNCTTSECHGGGAPVWGSDTTDAECTKCHGVQGTTVATYNTYSKTAAPGYIRSGTTTTGVDTYGLFATIVNSVSSNTRVGAHNAHLNSLRNISAPIACNSCHVVPAGIDPTGADGHFDGDGVAEVTFGGLAVSNGASPLYTDGTTSATCNNTYCHFGKSINGYAPAYTNATVSWTNQAYLNGSTADCQKCHLSPPSASGTHNGVSFPGGCNACHSHVTTLGTFNTPTMHINGVVEGGGDCITCHSTTKPSGTPKRAASALQMQSGLSHHVQLSTGTLSGEHCYKCHWEANSNGTVNPTYHTQVTNSPVDLVIWGASTTRPATYTSGVTATSYLASSGRAAYPAITLVCTGCHNQTNLNTQPFSASTGTDTHNTSYYSWDGSSVDSRYSSGGTTTWGKYTTYTFSTSQRNIKKAYSAHGNAANNARGFSLVTGQDSTTSVNTSGNVNVLCYDCHNSHGSDVPGLATNYTSSTTVGGLLKDVTNGLGGFTATYASTTGGSGANKNSYSPGAALCFDCHLNSAATTTRPWGYGSVASGGTYSSSQPIIGYNDSMFFDNAAGIMSAARQRYTYKQQSGNGRGGHLGASSTLTSTGATPIRGLCTPCHDPHGVSTSITQQYGVPLLKGTWMTSLYNEDAAPIRSNEARGGGSRRSAVSSASIPGYNIDQTVFGKSTPNKIHFYSQPFPGTSKITQTAGQFGGLCLGCHPQTKIQTVSSTATQWGKRDRVHNAVKGWATYGTGSNAGNAIHAYPCAKCHTPHNAALPRLLITNCLDFKHRGRTKSAGKVAAYSYAGSAGGNGRFPAGGGGYQSSAKSTDWAGVGSGGAFYLGIPRTAAPASPNVNRACHDNAANNSNASFPSYELWNSVTPW